jgi:predicted transcriptional regulator
MMLKDYLELRGISDVEFCKRAKISVGTLKRLLKGEPITVDVAKRVIAETEVLAKSDKRVSYEELLGITTKKGK